MSTPPRLRGHGMTLLVAMLLLFEGAPRGQDFTGFDDFLRRHEAAQPGERATLTRLFIGWQQSHGGFPITNRNGEVVFVYVGSGEERDVRLTGDFLPINFFNVYWDTSGEPMARSEPVFYARRKFEPDARVDYQFVIDGKATRDPLNPRSLFSGPGGGEVSELVMPDHHLPTDTIARAGIPGGTIQTLSEPWAAPAVRIYVPAGYRASQQYPTLYTADGSAWLDLIRLPTLLDNLIAEGAIEPILAVMIDAAPDRGSWYNYNPDYLTYLRRVADHVDTHYSTQKRRDARLHAGTSAGGKATAYVGLELPDMFGNIAMLSPSFGGSMDYFEPYLAGRKLPSATLRVWMSAGTYEGYIRRDTETLEAYFKKAGIPTTAVYLHQGHSFGAWREATVQMLKSFFHRQQ